MSRPVTSRGGVGRSLPLPPDAVCPGGSLQVILNLCVLAENQQYLG